MKLASIDVGTNTARLLAAEVEEGRITREILNLREMTRLGESLSEGGLLSPAARERTARVLGGWSRLLADEGVFDVSAIATEALRRARDAEGFVTEVNERTGLGIHIISGEEEARLTLVGVRADLGAGGRPGWKLVIDIGGGSVEFVLTEDWNRFKAVSIPIGAVGLYERFLHSDPPTDLEMSDLLDFCHDALLPLQDFLPKGGPVSLIGTAGTITTLAAVDLGMDIDAYDPKRITGHALVRDTVAKLLERFIDLSEEQRMLIAGLEHGRADIIVSGTALLAAIMDRAGAGSITVCDSGLREGNLLDYFEKKAR